MWRVPTYIICKLTEFLSIVRCFSERERARVRDETTGLSNLAYLTDLTDLTDLADLTDLTGLAGLGGLAGLPAPRAVGAWSAGAGEAQFRSCSIELQRQISF